MDTLNFQTLIGLERHSPSKLINLEGQYEKKRGDKWIRYEMVEMTFIPTVKLKINW